MRGMILRTLLLLALLGSPARADIDWRTKGAVRPIANAIASTCNRSWAFATTGLLEGAWTAIGGMPLANLSEQELLDCTSSCGSAATQCSGCTELGCGFSFIETMGLCDEAAYPYTGQVGTCASWSPLVPSGFAMNWTRLSGESGLAGALAQAPVLARLEIGVQGATLPAYRAYTAGVFAPGTTDASVVQWVLVVGYTSSFFIVKNSLGTGWGNNGYMFLARGANRLGINNFAYALNAGSPSQGACTQPDGSCFEMDTADCASANGSFGGLGTFCAVAACPASFGLKPVPALSTRGMFGLILVLALSGFALLRRTARITCLRSSL